MAMKLCVRLLAVSILCLSMLGVGGVAAAAGSMVEGVVESSDGLPISGATVCIEELSLCVSTPTMVALGDGYFHIDTPDVGSVSMTLTVSAPGYQDKTQTIDFEEHPGGVSYSRGNTVILEPVSQHGATISGYVHDTEGNSISNVWISNYAGLTIAHTDSTGYFEVHDVEDGTYSLRAGRNVDGGPWRYFPSDFVQITVSGEDVVVNFILEREATISMSGRIVDSNANPVGGAEVAFAWTLRGERFTTSNPDGSFTITGIPANSMFAQQISVLGADCTWQQIQYFDVSDAVNASGGDVGTLVYTACGIAEPPTSGDGDFPAPVHQVTGQVLDLNGSPVAGASVCTPMSGWGDTLCVLTNADGHFNVGKGTTSSFLSGFSQVPVTVTFEDCSGQKTVPYQDGVIEVGTIQLDCEINQPGNGEVVENSFTLIAAQRMCADQSFQATWTGDNLTSVEFALSNSSDDWTSGWMAADPNTGAYTASVDHHGYDRAAARVTFVDGTSQQVEINTTNCAEATAAQPVQPSTPGSSGSASGGSSTSGQSSTTVSGLPSTGAGLDTSSAAVSLIALAGATVMLASGSLVIRRKAA